MADEIDLSNPPDADAGSSGGSRSRRRHRETDGSKRGRTAREHVSDSEVKNQAADAFGRIGQMLRERDDRELAEIIEEDGSVMAHGLVLLTSGIKFLRGPLVIVLNLIVPALAFFRLGRVLLGRLRARQEARAAQTTTIDEPVV